jgi:cytochrome b561
MRRCRVKDRPELPTMNTQTQVPPVNAAPAAYDPVARVAHWLTFALVAAEFTVGWCMPDIEWGTEPTGLIGVHILIGSSLVIVVAFRLLWRLTHAAPPPLATLPAWQKWSATATHLALYGLLLIMLASGWASASARDWPLHAFGFIPLPHIVPAGTRLGFQLGDLHAGTLCWVLLAAIGVHVLAALHHHYIRRDAVLGRMLPSANRTTPQ